jgi:hypothetical protein
MPEIIIAVDDLVQENCHITTEDTVKEVNINNGSAYNIVYEELGC